MRCTFLSLAAAAVLVCASSTNAATLSGTTGETDFLISSGGANWNLRSFVEAPNPSGNANAYVDLDLDGVFGETGIGENTGNANATLGFTAAITDGLVLNFAVEGFGSAEATGSVDFIIENADLSTQTVSVTQGTLTAFTDSNGDMWDADFVFNNGGYGGDVVFNGGTTPGGANPDHQGVLTFSAVPEPASIAIAGLGLIGLIGLARRRR